MKYCFQTTYKGVVYKSCGDSFHSRNINGTVCKNCGGRVVEIDSYADSYIEDVIDEIGFKIAMSAPIVEGASKNMGIHPSKVYSAIIARLVAEKFTSIELELLREAVAEAERHGKDS